MKQLICILFLGLVFSCQQEPSVYHNAVTGQVFGTHYTVQFYGPKKVDYSKQYDSIFHVINTSLSTYQSNSLISKINSGDSTVIVDNHFSKVFTKAKEIYKQTNGYFDPTIGDIVNLWRFGPKTIKKSPDTVLVDSLMKYVGFKKVHLKNNRVLKDHTETFIDFNALAKGYALDVLADFLNHKKTDNYLIDIGGEVRAMGSKPNKVSWQVGIDDPNFDGSQSYKKIVALKDEALATSGVYRKYKVDEKGNKYAHIINTQTGFPSKTNVLSVSVIAPTCMEADGYATAFQAMGLEKTKQYLRKNKHLKVYFIYEEERGIKIQSLNQFSK